MLALARERGIADRPMTTDQLLDLEAEATALGTAPVSLDAPRAISLPPEAARPLSPNPSAFPVTLNGDWRVADDPLQWVLQRSKHAKAPRAESDNWSDRRYHRDRDHLFASTRELCGEVEPEALAMLAGLPERHPDMRPTPPVARRPAKVRPEAPTGGRRWGPPPGPMELGIPGRTWKRVKGRWLPVDTLKLVDGRWQLIEGAAD